MELRPIKNPLKKESHSLSCCLKKGDPIFALILIVSIAAFAIFLLVVGWVGYTVTSELQTKMGGDPNVDKAFDAGIKTSTVTINAFWYIMFAGLILGLFISAMMMKSYPMVAVPIFILIVIITVIVAIALSNAYEKVSQATQFADAAQQQSSIGFIILKLPYVAVILGLIAVGIAFGRPSGGSVGAIIN